MGVCSNLPGCLKLSTAQDTQAYSCLFVCCLQEIKAAVLRTITAIIHLERDPRLATIIEATGAATYHGFLPSMVRDCVVAFTSPDSAANTSVTSAAVEESEFPLSFATALFSFLYHLATYEASESKIIKLCMREFTL